MLVFIKNRMKNQQGWVALLKGFFQLGKRKDWFYWQSLWICGCNKSFIVNCNSFRELYRPENVVLSV